MHRRSWAKLFLPEKVHHEAVSASACGSTRPMDVVLLILWRIEMDDRLDARDVHTACCDVCGEQGHDLTLRPTLQSALTSVLRHTAMHRKCRYAKGVHRVGGPFGAEAVLDENDRALAVFEESSEVLVLRLELRLDDNVACALRRLELIFAFNPADVVNHRVVHVLTHQVVDIAVERGREQEHLAWPGDVVEELSDLRGEPHVRHAVGLVDDNHRDLVEPGFTTVDEVEQTTGCRNRYVDAALKVRDLSGHACTTEERGDPTFGDTRIGNEDLGNLFGQLSRRDQNQGLRRPGVGSFDSTQDRETVGQRLSRAGRCSTTDVFARERVGQRCTLDGEGVGNSGANESVEKRRGYTE